MNPLSSIEHAQLGEESLHPAPGKNSIPQIKALVSEQIITGQAEKERVGTRVDQEQVIKKELASNASFIANSSVMQEVRGQAELLAKFDVPVLIVGESGTGKKFVGRLIHNLSNRSANSFTTVSCSELDTESLERGLFGNESAWSYKVLREISPFTLCHGGTVFLDDIDEMPPRCQAKLMPVLQDKQLFSGGNTALLADVRLLAGTKMDIRTAVLSGKLRKNLYYSISAFTILVPPLRQRKDDIPFLMDHFMTRFASDYGLLPRAFSPAVLSECLDYSWPGNLRELEKFVKRYLVSPAGEAAWGHGEIYGDEIGPVRPRGKPNVPLQNPAARSLLYDAREEAERNAISQALEQNRWNRRAAARTLNVSYRTLLNKIQKYDMRPTKN